MTGSRLLGWNGDPIDPRRDWQEWTDILKAAGLPHYRLHAMRHSTATILLEKRVALAVVQEILGHSDIRVTRGYSHVSSALHDDAATRMGEVFREGQNEPTVPTGVPTP